MVALIVTGQDSRLPWSFGVDRSFIADGGSSLVDAGMFVMAG